MHNSITTYLLLRLYWNSMTIHIYLYQIITNIPWQYTVQIIVLAVHLNYETAHRYMKSNVKTNLRSMQVTQERTRHTQADWTEKEEERSRQALSFHRHPRQVQEAQISSYQPRSPLGADHLWPQTHSSCLWSQQKAANIITHSIRLWSMQQGAHQKLHKTAHSLPHETWLQKLQKLHVSLIGWPKCNVDETLGIETLWSMQI